MKRTILQLRNVRRVFHRSTADQVIALDGINLDVNEEDFITIIGSNGSGKSTLLNIVAGVFPPERGGAIIINQTDVTKFSEYKRAAYVGRVWQEPRVGTAGDLSIEENLSLALRRDKSKGLRYALSKRRRVIFVEALAQLGMKLENRLKSQAGTLSGGQRQALALIMATVSKPTILLLDEHIATLDPRTARIVLELTEMIIREEKTTALMVTHNMEHALRYGNRLVMMHQGRIVVDIDGEQKTQLTIDDLVRSFERAAGEQFKDDSILLTHD